MIWLLVFVSIVGLWVVMSLVLLVDSYRLDRAIRNAKDAWDKGGVAERQTQRS